MDSYNITENMYFNNSFIENYYNCSDNKTNMVCYSDKDFGYNIFQIWCVFIIAYTTAYQEKLFGIKLNLFNRIFIISCFNYLIKLSLVSLTNGNVSTDDIIYIILDLFTLIINSTILAIIVAIIIIIIGIIITIIGCVILFICMIISLIIDKLFKTNFTNSIINKMDKFNGKTTKPADTNNKADENIQTTEEEENVEVRRSLRFAEKNKTE